jgi:hypothetical protein
MQGADLGVVGRWSGTWYDLPMTEGGGTRLAAEGGGCLRTEYVYSTRGESGD